jgi:hypothetical protein
MARGTQDSNLARAQDLNSLLLLAVVMAVSTEAVGKVLTAVATEAVATEAVGKVLMAVATEAVATKAVGKVLAAVSTEAVGKVLTAVAAVTCFTQAFTAVFTTCSFGVMGVPGPPLMERLCALTSQRTFWFAFSRRWLLSTHKHCCSQFRLSVVGGSKCVGPTTTGPTSTFGWPNT